MVFVDGPQWESSGGREEAGREEGRRRRRQKEEKGGMLTSGTANCTHLKNDSGSHYTKGSFCVSTVCHPSLVFHLDTIRTCVRKEDKGTYTIWMHKIST